LIGKAARGKDASPIWTRSCETKSGDLPGVCCEPNCSSREGARRAGAPDISSCPTLCEKAGRSFFFERSNNLQTATARPAALTIFQQYLVTSHDHPYLRRHRCRFFSLRFKACCK